MAGLWPLAALALVFGFGRGACMSRRMESVKVAESAVTFLAEGRLIRRSEPSEMRIELCCVKNNPLSIWKTS